MMNFPYQQTILINKPPASTTWLSQIQQQTNVLENKKLKKLKIEK
jgi:hypothetical protein